MAENNSNRGLDALGDQEQRDIAKTDGQLSGDGRSENGQPKSKRGLASADEQTRQRVAREGGTTVSRDRKHMSEIGRKGGENSHGGGRQSTNR